MEVTTTRKVTTFEMEGGSGGGSMSMTRSSTSSSGGSGGGRKCTQRDTEFFGTNLNIRKNGPNNKVSIVLL